MRSNRRRDTKPEMAIRRLLHARGYRYRVDFAPWSNKRRRADIVFTRRRLAVFIDGCFWHGCPEHGTIPVSHADYWEPKLVKNRERDAETTAMVQGAVGALFHCGELSWWAVQSRTPLASGELMPRWRRLWQQTAPRPSRRRRIWKSDG